jgi:hypothetical protein
MFLDLASIVSENGVLLESPLGIKRQSAIKHLSRLGRLA